jgi:cell division protein FtsN
VFSLTALFFVFHGVRDVARVEQKQIERAEVGAERSQTAAKQAGPKASQSGLKASQSGLKASLSGKGNDASPSAPASAPRNDAGTASRDALDGVPSPTAPGLPFSVQVGSFRNPVHAADLAERLSSRGYPASVSAVKLAGGETMHRVRIGAFKTREEARHWGERLKRENTFVQNFFVAADR